MSVRLAPFVLAALALAAAGCGGGSKPGGNGRDAAVRARTAPASGDLVVGVVGPYDRRVQGAWLRHGDLDQVAGEPLVLVRAGTPAASHLPAVAAAHPDSHFVLVGASARRLHLPNLAGVVLRDAQAAHLAGMVAALVVQSESAGGGRVGWTGPEDDSLLAAFRRGVHAVDRRIAVLHAWSADVPAACKEGALQLVARRAAVVAAARGTCARAAADGAHEQNVVAMRLGDFELPGVAAASIVRDAVVGIYHGGEDIVFGERSGAIGVSQLDPRIGPEIAIHARSLAGQAERAAGAG